MTVGIIGLGLIGGSFAKAYGQAGHTVLALDTDRSTLNFAMVSGVVTEELTKENAAGCDLILIAINPEAACRALEEFAPHFGSKGVVDEIHSFVFVKFFKFLVRHIFNYYFCKN